MKLLNHLNDRYYALCFDKPALRNKQTKAMEYVELSKVSSHNCSGDILNFQHFSQDLNGNVFPNARHYQN